MENEHRPQVEPFISREELSLIENPDFQQFVGKLAENAAPYELGLYDLHAV